MEYDYIIAGGGSAACVAATRLVRDFDARVLLIERGPESTSWLMRIPAGYMKYLAREDFLEMHRTVPQDQLDGRAPIIPQAKALGGGSAVNAMVYMRGQREDYDGWDEFLGGNSGWSYADMLPHFRKLERNTRFNNEYHGIDGGLWVSDPGYTVEMTDAFVLAAQGRGIPFNSDFNGEKQAGVGLMQNTIGNNERCDAVRAFLSQVRDSPNLKVVTKATVTRILIEKGRAKGVEYSKGGKTSIIRTGGEVLVATGTYNTAKLLMLSGIGPADHLGGHGIKCCADVPGVGENLQDHHEVPLICSMNKAAGYFGQDRGWRMIRNGLQYLAFRTGPTTTIGVEACAFHDPDGGERPTIQLYCAPIVYLDRDYTDLKPTHGVTLTSCLLRPKARGSVRLRSADPFDKPLVDCRFFGDPDDLRLTIKAVRFAREVLATEPAASLISGEILPGGDLSSDEELRKYSNRMVKTNYHPVGTARMGRDDDPKAVVDTRLRVRGIENLRVIDCSAMPLIPSGNTNAPAMAVADRAVAIIRGE
ncbi:MAG: GMC family oxidoreductase N-terminal domain-containing protein [Albidovulum sp.]|nr:GMC family oxidoreductase N-terminal domain-containing protein [Albidovulum sp.]